MVIRIRNLLVRGSLTFKSKFDAEPIKKEIALRDIPNAHTRVTQLKYFLYVSLAVMTDRVHARRIDPH